MLCTQSSHGVLVSCSHGWRVAVWPAGPRAKWGQRPHLRSRGVPGPRAQTPGHRAAGLPSCGRGEFTGDARGATEIWRPSSLT